MMKHGTLGVFPFLHVACYPADRETVTIFFWLALPASLSTIPCRSYAPHSRVPQQRLPTICQPPWHICLRSCLPGDFRQF